MQDVIDYGSPSLNIACSNKEIHDLSLSMSGYIPKVTSALIPPMIVLWLGI